MVCIRFTTWQFSLSRALLFFMLLAVGLIIGWTTCAVSGRNKRHRKGSLQQEQE
ncbi:MAG: LapA family protein [Chitinispirillaceae bacterium]